MDTTTLIIAVLLLAEAIAAVVATLYVKIALRREQGKEPFLDRLINRDVRVALAGVPIAFVVGYSLVRFAVPELTLGPLVPPFGALLIGIPLALMLVGPISDAAVVWRERRTR
jgi:hypothetical protein